MKQVGRNIPRLEVRAKVTGRAEYVHNLRLPGMLYGKCRALNGAARPHPQHRYACGARAVAGVHRVVTGEDIRKLIAEPYYGPAFHDQPILALDKVHHVGEPVAVVLASDPHVAERAAQLIDGRIRGIAGGLRRSRGDAARHRRPRRAQAGRHFRRSEAPQGPQRHQCRARLSPAARRRRRGHGQTPSASSSTPSRRSNACICRSSRSCRSPSPATTR